MSLQAIQDAVLTQIPVLLHGKDNPAVLEKLTRKAVNEFQDRAGFHGSFRVRAEDDLCKGYLLPDDWLEMLSATDKNSVYVSTSIDEVENDAGDMETRLFVSQDFVQVDPPYTIKYLRDLSEVAFDAESVPISATGIIEKYLDALIAIPNNRRLTSMMIGLDHPGVDKIPDEQSMIDERKLIEEDMDNIDDLLLTTLVM